MLHFVARRTDKQKERIVARSVRARRLGSAGESNSSGPGLAVSHLAFPPLLPLQETDREREREVSPRVTYPTAALVAVLRSLVTVEW